MVTGYYQKKQRQASKKVRERYQDLSQEEGTKIANMLVNDKEIFPK